MRNEKEMYALVLETARSDERIRAVILNGSRANPVAPRDIFQDYDIVYVVTDVASFTRDPQWIQRFGDLMIFQLPDAMGDAHRGEDERYACLMQFTDGNRIDLTLYPIARLDDLGKDRESRLLLDKDGIMPPFPPASDSDYFPKPPTAKEFADCCNEFWWVNPYVAKGLWREEITSAKYWLDQTVRKQLMKMLAWYVGVGTQFRRNPGKLGRHLERCLEPELWAQLLRTYADADYTRTWDALFAMGDLFRTAACRVAEHFGFEYPHGDDERVSAHLKHVRSLPRNAKEIY
jgi:aminoglycoside 6-adenylyltransferase